ncbi:MAG: hypothetical protein ACLFM8_06760 [Halobacteriales archaeon]
MGIRTRAILGEGLYRTFRPNGLVLVAALVVAGVVMQVGLSSLLLEAVTDVWDDILQTYPEVFEGTETPDDALPLAVEMPRPLALFIFAIGLVATVLAVGVAVRVFASDRTDVVPRDLVVDDLVWMGVNLLVGTIIFAILWIVGLSLFVVPGVVAFVLLIYFVPAVAIEGRSFVDAMARSWRITRGNRLAVFVLFLAYFVFSILVTLVALVVGSFAILLHPIAAELVTQVANGFLHVLFAAVVARSFQELVPRPSAQGDDGDAFDEFIPADRNVQW